MAQNLRERLEALRALQSFVESRWEKPEAAGQRPAAGERPAPNPIDIGALVEGEDHATPFGACFHRRVYYPLGHRHGHFRLGELLDIAPEAAGFLAQPREERLDLRQAVFLDTETTGLAGGAGTYAFLVGVGHFTDDAFLLHQFFMRDYPDEPALMYALNETLAPFRYLVTFCGRGFDWPLLAGRFIYNRMRPTLSDPVHLDLIYPSRRLWKERWGSCRLVHLEENLLGAGREDDVPGAMIPGLYFDYLRSRDATPLVEVLRHNERDIVSLVTLATALARRYHDPLQACDCPYELHGLGRQFERLGRLDEAAACYQAAYAIGPAAPHAREALFRSGCLLKRLKRLEEAVEAFLLLTGDGVSGVEAAPGGYAVEACIELAKHYEHRAANPARALTLTEQAMALARRSRRLSGGTRDERHLEAIKRRSERLQRKVLGILSHPGRNGPASDE